MKKWHVSWMLNNSSETGRLSTGVTFEASNFFEATTHFNTYYPGIEPIYFQDLSSMLSAKAVKAWGSGNTYPDETSAHFDKTALEDLKKKITERVYNNPDISECDHLFTMDLMAGPAYCVKCGVTLPLSYQPSGAAKCNLGSTVSVETVEHPTVSSGTSKDLDNG